MGINGRIDKIQADVPQKYILEDTSTFSISMTKANEVLASSIYEVCEAEYNYMHKTAFSGSLITKSILRISKKLLDKMECK